MDMARNTATDEVQTEGDGGDRVVLAGERFPSDGVTVDEGEKIGVDSGVVNPHSDVGDGGAQGADVVDVAGDEITVEYPRHRDTETATVGIEHVYGTDLEAGERVTVSYDSVYTDDDAPRTTKTATVSRVRSGGRIFDGVWILPDGGTELKIGRSGVVTTIGDTRRRIGYDAVVERVEEKLVVPADVDTVSGIDAVVGDHARKSQRAGFDDLADELFRLQSRAIDATLRITQPELEDPRLEYSGDELDISAGSRAVRDRKRARSPVERRHARR